MLGAIVGDIVGSPYELPEAAIKTTEFPLFSAQSRFTDDTVMTVAVAAALMWGAGSPECFREALIDAMHMYGRMFPQAGYGQQFSRWLASGGKAPYNSYGNGSAMRVSPVAWVCGSLEQVELYARISAEVTHNHPEGVKGACATAAAVYMARSGAGRAEIEMYVSQHYGYVLGQSLEEIRSGYQHDFSCQGSVPQSISAFLHSDSFEDALRNAVSLGGDSDTMAAISGSIAEAFYGEIPGPIVAEAFARLDSRLIALIEEWTAWLHTGKTVHS